MATDWTTGLHFPVEGRLAVRVSGLQSVLEKEIIMSALQHHRLSHSSSLCRRGCLWSVLGDNRSLFTATSIGHTVNTPRSTVVLEKLTFPRQRSYSLHFMEPELSLPCLQTPYISPILSQIRPDSRPLALISVASSLIYSPSPYRSSNDLNLPAESLN